MSENDLKNSSLVLFAIDKQDFVLLTELSTSNLKCKVFLCEVVSLFAFLILETDNLQTTGLQTWHLEIQLLFYDLEFLEKWMICLKIIKQVTVFVIFYKMAYLSQT